MIDCNKIALVGMACRLPGDSDTPDSFFENLILRKNFVSEIPADRWNVERFYNENGNVAGRSNVKRGHFLNYDYRKFDAGFFGFAPREVEYFDPQQRLLLEVAWEAMENAGIDATALAGTDVGVYVGGFTVDHLLNQLGASGRANIGTHSAAGATLTMLSNRLSYAFDFRGPSISIDTACSSSLVALSYAVQDIVAGRCQAAMVGGVNMMLRPEYTIAMSKGKFLAKDGRSKSFDASADGYGRGEGAALVILKPLAHAQRDGDNVLAIVEAAGVNQDGRTSGITVPNPQAQETLMLQTIKQAGIDPHTVQYVEAHGTGTPVGDPIEAAAIARVYGQGRTTPCVVGSVKSNIGHLEAAAGIAALVKATMMLRYNIIPPLAALDSPNPDIPFGENNLVLATTTRTLAATSETRRIAINSFGYGGTNAHAILSLPTEFQSDGTLPEHEASAARRFNLLPLSAQNENALRELAGRYADQLAVSDDPLEDIIYSASRRRSHLRHRLAVWGDSKCELVDQLLCAANKETSSRTATGVQPFDGKSGPVFVYTGMGPQWWGMGQQLYRDNVVYRNAVERADSVFQEIAGFSILAEMLKDERESTITATEFAQPANFVLQVGLTEMLAAEGVVPAAVVGHSVGEVASAWASGALSLEDALRVSRNRSRIQAKAAGQGGMLAIGLPLDRAEELISDIGALVSIAAVNSPASVTLAGDELRLADIRKQLESEGIFARTLTVEVPYHSPMMEPLKAELNSALKGLQPRTVHTPLYSTVTAALADETPFDAGYWCANIREPVYFSKTIQAILADDYSLFVEIGPRPVLRGALRETFAALQSQASSTQTLQPDQPETESMYRAVAETYCQGGAVNWSERHQQGRLINLPNYPWQRETFWHEAETQRLDRQGEIVRPLLGIAAPGRRAWRLGLGDQHLAYLADHRVDGMPVMPAAAYIEAMLEAAAESDPARTSWALRDISIDQALIINPEKPLQMELRLAENGRLASLVSYNELEPDTIIEHATGRLYPLPGAEDKKTDVNDLVAKLPDATDITELYQQFAGFALHYGPLFQPIRRIQTDRSRGEVLARLELPVALNATARQYCMHPVLLDGCFQMALSLLDPGDAAYLPTAIGELQLIRPLPSVLWCWGKLVVKSPQEIVCDLTLLDEDDSVVAKIRGFKCSALRGARREKSTYPAGDYHYVWRPAQPVASKHPARWLIDTDTNDKVSAFLRSRLTTAGGGTVRLACWNGTSTFDAAIAAEVDAIAVWLSDGIDCSDPTGETGTVRLLNLAKALESLGEDAPRLYLITRGAFAVVAADRHVVPAQGALVGFMRTVHNEIGAVRATTIDLPFEYDDSLLAMLEAELCADAEFDEVALRNEGRFVAELQQSGLFATRRTAMLASADGDRIEFVPGEGDTALAVRAAAPVCLHPDEIELRIDAAMFEDNAALLGYESESMMAISGRVERAGEAVSAFNAGDHVCGFVPAASASHIRCNPADIVCTTVPANKADATAILSVTVRAIALCLADGSGLRAGDSALICETLLGAALAEVLEAEGITVVRLPGQSSAWRIGFRDALENSAAEGFDCLAVPLDDWDSVFGFNDLAPGGCLIDIGGKGVRRADVHVGRLVRFDQQLRGRRDKARLLAALRRVVDAGPCSISKIRKLTPADLVAGGAGLPPAGAEKFVVDYSSKQPVEAIALDAVPVRSDGAYLVTGGFGGLGKETARWLARCGAGHIAIASRRGAAGDAEQAFVRELEGTGCQVSAHALDISDLPQVRALFNELDNTGLQLRGVLHAAGVLEDKPITAMQLADVRKVLRPKALGAYNLHSMTENRALDLFVLYSSISVLVGNSRQANYCAANGMLDALAWNRRLAGLPALSINLGAIGDVGMLGEDENIGAHLSQIGLTPLAFGIALKGLERAIAAGVTQVCIAAEADWNKWAIYESSGGKSPRFRNLVEGARAAQDNSASARLREHLLPLGLQEREEVMTALISEVFSAELRIPADQIEAERPLQQFGIDSLLATDIQLQLDTALNVSVSALELVGDTTIATIARQSLIEMAFDAETSVAA